MKTDFSAVVRHILQESHFRGWDKEKLQVELWNALIRFDGVYKPKKNNLTCFTC